VLEWLTKTLAIAPPGGMRRAKPRVAKQPQEVNVKSSDGEALIAVQMSGRLRV
jgi:hypothetical protein